MSRPTAVDLFCGAGGLTQGLKNAGFRVLAAVEIDTTACEAYRDNHADVKLIEKDIRTVTRRNVLGSNRKTIDLLAACPPCQGFSSMRTKNGKRKNRDEQNDLIFEVLRLVRSLRPKGVMLENVPGLARSEKFTKFLKGLRSVGYECNWAILNTNDYGVPQSRRRLIVLAGRTGVPEFASECRRRRTVREAIGHLPTPATSSDPLHNYVQAQSSTVAKRIRSIPKNGGSRSALVGALKLSCHKSTNGFKDVYGRMAWNKPAPTITGGCINPSKGRFVHPTQNRAITIREAALLQTFPARYRLPIHRGRYAMALLVGNALPPEFIRRQAEAMREYLEAS